MQCNAATRPPYATVTGWLSERVHSFICPEAGACLRVEVVSAWPVDEVSRAANQSWSTLAPAAESQLLTRNMLECSSGSLKPESAESPDTVRAGCLALFDSVLSLGLGEG